MICLAEGLSNAVGRPEDATKNGASTFGCCKVIKKQRIYKSLTFDLKVKVP